MHAAVTAGLSHKGLRTPPVPPAEDQDIARVRMPRQARQVLGHPVEKGVFRSGHARHVPGQGEDAVCGPCAQFTCFRPGHSERRRTLRDQRVTEGLQRPAVRPLREIDVSQGAERVHPHLRVFRMLPLQQ